MSSVKFVAMMRFRDSLIMSCLRGGALPLDKKFYDVEAKTSFMDILRASTTNSGLFAPVTQAYPIEFAHETPDQSLWQIIVQAFKYTPFGLVINLVYKAIVGLKAALPEELRPFMDIIVVAAVSIAFGGIAGSLALVPDAESKNPNLWQEVGKGAFDIVRNSATTAALSAISVDQMAEIAENVIKSISAKDRLLCIGVARTIDRKFGKTAVGGTEGGGWTWADYLGPMTASTKDMTIRNISIAAAIVGGAILVKALLKKKEK